MNGTQDSSQNEDRTPPPGFRSLLSIFEMSNEELTSKGNLVNVIGVVTDCRPPVQTRHGADWKMEISLMDLSIEDHERGYVMKFNIFKPSQQMPPVPAVGQPVVLRLVKAGFYGSTINLLSNRASEITYFPPNKPNWPPSSADHLPDPSYTTVTTNSRALKKPVSQEIRTYIAMLQNRLREDSMPSKIDYEASTLMARNVKDKFSELKDITPGNFYDLLVQVVSIYRLKESMVTVYVTDYTVNESFYDTQNINGAVVGEDADDPYGYLQGRKLKPQKTNDGKDWAGPNGKMSLQLTAFDEQGEYFEAHVEPKQWVKLRNVQIKASRDDRGSIEGVLRNDSRDLNRIQVQVLQIPQSPEDVDPQWKNAIRRMKEYERQHKHEKKYVDDSTKADGKRKADEESHIKPPNAKKRREEKRKAAELKARQDAERAKHKDVFVEKKAPIIRLNDLVKAKATSDPAAKSPITLSDILSFRPNLTLEDGTSITAPFTNSKYRSYVRVTDFFPHNIADFSVGKKASVYDALSDNESSSESENDDLSRKGDMSDFVKEGQWTWKWRFMIQVEDARRPHSDQDKENEDVKLKPRMWLAVDNDAGQFLLNSDACNLRADKTALNQIKEKLFILWGDLEERKTKFLNSEEGRILQSRTFAVDTGSPPPSPTTPSTFNSSPIKNGAKHYKLGEMPADSDEEDSSLPFATQQALPTPVPPPSNPDSPRKLKKLRPKAAAEKLEEKLRSIGEEAQNKPFEACIKEWGIESKDAEGGYRRAWGLFDTIIKF